LFIGGQNGKISELTIEGITQPIHPNSIKRIIRITTFLKEKMIAGAYKMIGVNNGKPSKKMVRKNLDGEVPQGAKDKIARFFGKIFSKNDQGD
jgi:hypothetical protein